MANETVVNSDVSMQHILKCHEIVKTDFVRGQGCYLYDSQDRQYIDFEAGIWCTALGNNHPRVKQAIHNQVEKLIHLGTRYPSALAEAAAVDVLRVVGLEGGKCLFLSSGSEAVEFGVQAARRITGKPYLLCLSGAYLAAYGSAGRKNEREWYSFDWEACRACPHPDGCGQCVHFNEMPFDQIGGFVFEPGNGSGLVQLPPKQLVKSLADRVKQMGGLVVVNEITTGMGRTGEWFGFHHYDLQPDIVAVGKGLGNGYPVSAAVMTAQIAAGLEDGQFRYAQSHQNDPLGCAVAIEVIAVMREEALVARSKQVGERFLQELKNLSARHAAIKEVRGRGLMIAVELESDPQNVQADCVYQALLEKGFLVGCSPAAGVLRFYPALTIDEEHIGQLLEAFDSILSPKAAQS